MLLGSATNMAYKRDGTHRYNDREMLEYIVTACKLASEQEREKANQSSWYSDCV